MQFGNAPAQGTIALILITALISTLMGVFGKSAAEALLNWLITPFKFIWELLYRWIAPRNPLSIALHSYKNHIRRSWLTKIENPIGPELDVPLEHAFAPLKLMSSSSQETIDLFTHVAASDRCIVLGGPGTGKTTLMKSLITSVINEQANERLNALIPVFVVLRRLATKQQSVRDGIIAAFSDYHFPGAHKFVDSALNQGRMLIILDGLDEVGVNRERVAGEIISFCESDDQQLNKNRLIVTCREYSYRSEDLGSVIKNIVRVEPFANHHMRVFLQGWPTYRGRSALKLYALIQGDSQIRDICRNPLLLTILTGLYLETSDFQFPSSRNLFYKAAIEELIIKRPARREIRQKFEAHDKWQVLQRVSLERLETVLNDEDPEDLTSDAIRKQVADVVRKEVDFSEFLYELIEVNGIIKPSSDGIYTCAHRTIQEYLAANEAGRIRTPKEVVERFSARPDLIEVLYFYCGLVSNIPQLTKIIQYFVNDRRWLEAGKCLLNMSEMPSGSYVKTITTELKRQILSGSEYKPALEILSSLAQRQQEPFDWARKHFSDAVHYLAGGDQVAGASALGSALATSPDAAMKVIPALLKHESKLWQKTAVLLLKDIGTDEALDKIVQLLTHDNEFIKAEAGRTLAGIIKSRNKDLRDRSNLLPDREDRVIWPLETLFPGKLAIPIAESLVDDQSASGNEAIDCAIKAIRSITRNDAGLGSSFLKSWRNIPRDLKRTQFRVMLGKAFMRTAFVTPILLALALIGIENWCYLPNKMSVFEVTERRLHFIDLELIKGVQTTAQEVVSEAEQTYSPNSSGMSRLLPQNWEVEPILPPDAAEAFVTIKSYSLYRLNPFDVVRDAHKLHGITSAVSAQKVQALDQSIASLTAGLPELRSEHYLLLTPYGRSFGVFIVITMVVFPLLTMVFMRNRNLTSRTRPLLIRFWLRNSGLNISLLLAVEYLLLFTRITNLRLNWLIIMGAIIVSGFGLGSVIRDLDWPRNAFLAVTNEVLPPRDTNRRESANQSSSGKSLYSV